MKKLLIVANWKSNKTSLEAKEWIKRVTSYDLRFTNKEIIVCPSFLHLPILKSYILNHKFPIKLGAQDISAFSEGAYTGEVNGRQLKEFVDYVLIGHSERRQNLNETDDILNKKVEMALEHDLKIIYCIQNEETLIPKGVNIIAYEPIFAIGTGRPETPENAKKIKEIVSKYNPEHFLYGGSVSSDNIADFMKSSMDGVLAGGASLDPLEFFKILENA